MYVAVSTKTLATTKLLALADFLQRKWSSEYDPTLLEEIYSKEVVVDDVAVHLEIIDTGPRQEFAALKVS